MSRERIPLEGRMANTIVETNFMFNAPVEEFEAAAPAFVDAFTNLPGLIWKIWLLNGPEREAGAILYFDSEESLNAYVDGPLVTALEQHPAVVSLSIKRFAIMPELTAATRGPVNLAEATV